MIKETAGIKERELFFICLAIVLGIQILLAPMEKVLGQSGWLAVVLSTLLGMVLMLLYGAWARLFAGKTWGQAFLETYGAAFGKILLFIYALVFFAIVVNTAWYLAYFWGSLGLTKTPQIIYIIGFMFFCVILAYGGSVVLGRLANILVFLAVAIMLINILLMLRTADFGNLQPLGVYDYPALGWTSVSSFLILFGELVLVLPFFSKLEQPKKCRRTMVGAVAVAGLVILLATIRNVGVLGESVEIYTFPLMQVLRLAEIGSSFNRIEVFGALIILTIGAIRLGTAFLATTDTLREMWQLPTAKSIIIPLAILALACTEQMYQYTEDLMYLMFTLYPLVIFVMGILLPAITLLVAKIKQKRKKTDGVKQKTDGKAEINHELAH